MNSSPALAKTIANTIARAPVWLRSDLLSKDDTVRIAAEETLAAMIATAIQQHDALDADRPALGAITV